MLRACNNFITVSRLFVNPYGLLLKKLLILKYFFTSSLVTDYIGLKQVADLLVYNYSPVVCSFLKFICSIYIPSIFWQTFRKVLLIPFAIKIILLGVLSIPADLLVFQDFNLNKK